MLITRIGRSAFVLSLLCYVQLVQVRAQGVASAESPALDSALADYFNYLSTPYTFQQRIQFASEARGSTPEEIKIEKHLIEQTVNHLPYYPGMPDPVLGEAAANSDVIVAGRALSRRSVGSNDQRFLFTEYVIRVDSVYMDLSQTVHPGDTILVASEGGSLPVNGVQVIMADPAFDQFTLQEPYVFSLKAIRHTGAFVAMIPWCFNLAGPYEVSASKLDRAHEKKRTPGEFVAALQAVIVSSKVHRSWP